MKTYNIIPQEIQITPEIKIMGISLGEQGRGRIRLIIPTPNDGLMEEGISKTGKPRLNSSKSDKGWICRISTSGAYIRGANGNVFSPDKSNWKLIGKGYGAFGDAGRIGNWDDILISTELETWILRVKPSRGDAYILHCDGNKVHKLDYPSAIAIDLDLGESGPNSKGNWYSL